MDSHSDPELAVARREIDRLATVAAQERAATRRLEEALVRSQEEILNQSKALRQALKTAAGRQAELQSMQGSFLWRATTSLRRFRRITGRSKVDLASLRTLRRYMQSKQAAEAILTSGLLDDDFYRKQIPEWQGPCWEHYLLYGAKEGRDPSPLFDTSFYIESHPEVAASGENPLAHYVAKGAGLGYDPHPLFNASFYVGRHANVLSSGLNPLAHYLTRGAEAGYDPHPLFETGFYAKTYLRDSSENPLIHYIQAGAFAGHAPHRLFDSRYYLRENPDVAAAGVDPLIHYLQHGWQQKRNPHPLFDVDFYLKQRAGAEPLTDYLLGGAWADRDPHPLFDSSYYLEQNPDVAAAKINPLLHYVANGAREMRNPHPLFVTSFYAGQNRDVATSGVEPLTHFLAKGEHDPHPLFDSSYYLEQNPDVAGSGVNPLVHYVLTDPGAKRNPHPLFDVAYYLRMNPDADGFDPLIHYAEHGTEDGRDPHPLFQTSYYLKQDPEIVRSRELPVLHYLRVGFLEGRNPNPLFDTAWYRTEHPELGESGTNPLVHFVLVGGDPHPLFDTAYYLKRYPDVRKAGVNPLAHYFSIGPGEDRDPHPMFDSAFYREHCPEVSQALLVHYLESGAKQGLDPHPDFDTAYYLDTYPEARSSGLNPLIHYVLFGRKLGYFPNPYYRAYWERPLTDVRGSESPQNRDREPAVKLIAFYLPQFHPIPENDQWWGEGFTEWRNVISAKPVFPGHHQPQLPANLGFYDLRVPEVMDQQAELAADYGIHGFCLYYYWFNGRKLLDLPLNRMLSSGRPDFPFCLCWANENWTRSWDGLHDHILVEQRYSAEADKQLVRDLLPAFRDERYIRVKGSPLFLVYRVTQLPDPAATAERWREICAQAGIPEIHLCAVMSLKMGDPRDYGFDSAVEFPPQGRRHLVWPQSLPGVSEDFEGFMEDYVAMARYFMTRPEEEYPRYRGVIPGWDNSARRGNRAHIVVRSSPEAYEKWLRAIVEQTLEESDRKAPLIFINAWNEWAEGAHIEPDQRYGLAYLEATRRALSDGMRAASRRSVEQIADVHSMS